MDSGGSRFTFLAEDEKEARFFVKYVADRGSAVVLQEYIKAEVGEFTVGVLSDPSGDVLGSIALKRQLDNRLSYQMKYDDRVISSGISQGYIDSFDQIRKQCEKLAKLIGSRWSLNIQGRVIDDTFIPFEINPRHSGTTYLRALAGFNEPDILLQYCLHNRLVVPKVIRPGYYLRSLSEMRLPIRKMKK